MSRHGCGFLRNCKAIVHLQWLSPKKKKESATDQERCLVLKHALKLQAVLSFFKI